MGRSQHARQTVQSWGKVVTGGRFGGSRREAPSARAAIRSPPATVRRGWPAGPRPPRRGHGRGGKCRLHSIANRLEVDAAVGGDRLTQEGEVAIDRRAHRRAVSLPQAGRALDIREEEGDGAARQLGHDRSLGRLDRVRQRGIVAWDSGMAPNSVQLRLGSETTLCDGPAWNLKGTSDTYVACAGVRRSVATPRSGADQRCRAVERINYPVRRLPADVE